MTAMIVNFDKKFFVKQFTYFGFVSYLFGYISYIKDMLYLLPLVILFGIVFVFFFCMWIRSFFVKAIEVNEEKICFYFLFSKKTFQISSISDVDLDKKQICILSDKEKKRIYSVKWVRVSDLCKLKEIINT